MNFLLAYEKTVEEIAEKKGISKEEQFRQMMAETDKKEGIEKIITLFGGREEIEKRGGRVEEFTVIRKMKTEGENNDEKKS